MVYELGFYESFLKQLTRLPQGSIPTEDYDRLATEIMDAASEVMSQVRQRFIPSAEVPHYARQHQAALVNLKNEVLKIMGVKYAACIWDNTLAYTGMGICKCVYRSLESILFFIEDFLCDYTTQYRKLPEAKRIVAVSRMQEEMKVIRERCEAAGADSELVDIAMMPVEQMAASPKAMAYADYLYLEELMKQLLQVQWTTSEDANRELMDVLYGLNFNSCEFYIYCSEQWNLELREIGTLREQLNKLNGLQKHNMMKKAQTGYVLLPEYPSLKELLSFWLQTEIDTVKEEMTLLGYKPAAATSADVFKLETSMSVAQLVYLKRLQIETDKAPEPCLERFFRFIADNYATARQGAISPKSIHTSFYSFSPATKAAVEVRLQEMIQLSKRGVRERRQTVNKCIE